MDAKLHRRWFRFSLRTLLVFVTIASAGFGWLGMKVRAKQWEREAVKVIEDLGGMVWYEYHGALCTDPADFIPSHFTPLQELVGRDFFANVVAVSFGSEMTDADLRHLARFNQLERVYLVESQITDAGLVQLKGLDRLVGLYLDGTKVTDSGIDQLQNALPNLMIFNR